MLSKGLLAAFALVSAIIIVGSAVAVVGSGDAEPASATDPFKIATYENKALKYELYSDYTARIVDNAAVNTSYTFIVPSTITCYSDSTDGNKITWVDASYEKKYPSVVYTVAGFADGAFPKEGTSYGKMIFKVRDDVSSLDIPASAFAGWSVEARGYGIDGGDNIAILTSSSSTAEFGFVDYVYGGAPAGSSLPVKTLCKVGSTVTLPTVEGYTCSWTTEDAEISDGSFTMPTNAVSVSGTWSERADWDGKKMVFYIGLDFIPNNAENALPGWSYTRTGETSCYYDLYAAYAPTLPTASFRGDGYDVSWMVLYVSDDGTISNPEIVYPAGSVYDSIPPSSATSVTFKPIWTYHAILIPSGGTYLEPPQGWESTGQAGGWSSYDCSGQLMSPLFVVGEETTIILPEEPTRNGFVFGGWKHLRGDVWDVYVAGAAYTVTDQTTFVANWVSTATYDVVFNLGDGTSKTQTVVQGAKMILPDIERSGHALTGWYSDSGLSTLVGVPGDSYTVNNTITLYAEWTGEFRVDLGLDGGAYTDAERDELEADGWSFNMDSTSMHKTAGVGIHFTLPGGPAKSGFNFKGWEPATGSAVSAGSGFTLDSNTSFSAQWIATAGEVTITFETNGGSSVDSITTAPACCSSCPIPRRRIGSSKDGILMQYSGTAWAVRATIIPLQRARPSMPVGYPARPPMS